MSDGLINPLLWSPSTLWGQREKIVGLKVGGGGLRVGVGEGGTKTVSQTVKRGKRQNSNQLQNVKQVIHVI